MQMEQFLPVEIIIAEIISRLPVDSAIQCKQVCKIWRALMDDPAFVAVHTHRFISSENHSNSSSVSSAILLFLSKNGSTSKYQFIEYNYDNRIPLKLSNTKRCPFFLESLQPHRYWELFSSCNGLVFMCFNNFTRNKHMFVCNPCTREYVNLGPSLSINTSDEKNEYHFGHAYGFGYHPHTKEYKIVIISYKKSLSYGQVIVYTLGSGRWRTKGKLPNFLSADSVMIVAGAGVLVNGALHWIVKKGGKTKDIVFFDLEDEEFRVVPSPPSPAGTHLESIGLFAGCLCVTRRSNYESKSSDIWVMKNNKQYSWTRELRIPWKEEEELYSHCFLACMKRGKILLYSGFKHLVSYDPETDSFEKNQSSHHDLNWFTFTPYEKSFVSLKALGEKDTKYVSI